MSNHLVVLPIGNAIIAAFEVEYTTAIYSGLLRMSDLVSMRPNIKIDLFLLAPDQRRDMIAYEIHLPSFARPIAVPALDLPPSPLLPRCGGGGMNRWGQNSVHKAVVHLPDRGRACELDCS